MKNISELGPFKCKSCGFIFIEPKILLDRGAKVEICPFCEGRDVEKFTIVITGDEIKVIKDYLEGKTYEASPEKISNLIRKLGDVLKLAEKGDFGIQISKEKKEEMLE